MQRYAEPGGWAEMAPTSDGGYVRYSDMEDERADLLAALEGLRSLILGECPSAYECVDGERADAAIAKVKSNA